MQWVKSLFKNRRLLFVLSSSIVIILFFSWYYQLPVFLADRYQWYVEFGNKYYLQSKYTKAIAYADYAIAIDGSNPKGYELKIDACLRMEKFECIEKALSKLGEINKDTFYYTYAGYLQLKRGNVSDAKYYFRKSIDINTSYPPGYALLGLLSAQENNLDDAKTYLDQAMLLTPQVYGEQDPYRLWMFGAIHVGYAIVYEKKGQAQEAAQELRQATLYRPNSPERVLTMIS